MMLGQAAGAAAALAVTADTPAQDVRIALLQDRLAASGQVFTAS
jgi:hypothetical protein